MVPSGVIFPDLIVGLFVVGAGILIVRHRVGLNRHMFKTQQSMFGSRAARFSAGRQTPFMMGVVGVLTVLLGATMVVVGIVGIVQRIDL